MLAGIGAAPQRGSGRIHRLRIFGIEHEEINYAAQAEHAPAFPGIVRDVRAGHVARNEDGVRVERADGGIEHRTAPARPNDAKVAGPFAGEAR
jgi:hypothetical protein